MMPQDCYTGQTSTGIDVSTHQGTINWSKVGRSGVDFAIIRTGFGTGEDSRFEYNWREAGKTGLRRGSYQYLKMDRDGREQARVMANAIRKAGGLKWRDLPPAADVEGLEPDKPWNANATPDHIVRVVSDFMDEIERQLGRKPILYTGGYWVSKFSGREELARPFSKYALWRPHYHVNCPRLVPGFDRWTFWQRSNAGEIPGIRTRVDMNVFRGGPLQLAAFVAKSRGFPWGWTAVAALAAGVGWYWWRNR